MASIVSLRGALACLGAVCLLSGCVVREVCYSDLDCEGNRVCDLTTGSCGWQCETDAHCADGLTCDDHLCVLQCLDVPRTCPDDMVSVCGTFCIDVWEASRPDATADNPGTDTSMATSRPDVLPWATGSPDTMNQQVAGAACAAAGKRLCATWEWRLTCRGPDDLDYCYGDAYDPVTCNGIDTFCDCEPYPHCNDDCGSDRHVTPTGSFADCTNGWGIYDINGNVWELVASDDGLDHYRGGAYNCADSERLHACDYDAAWNPSAKGFRCCADGEAP